MTDSRMRLHTTMGAAAFHFRVRDGIGWVHSAMVARKGGDPAPGAGIAEEGRNERECRPRALAGAVRFAERSGLR